MSKVTFYKGGEQPLELHKVRVVQKLHLVPIERRMEALKEGDFNTVLDYFTYIGPNYYSFNIGSVHYVVLDDILCKNTGAGTSESRV
jgi:hypothetical protein